MVNYTYTTNDNVINMVETVNVKYCDVITIKGREDVPKCKTPFILQEPVSTFTKQEQSEFCVNAIT